MIPPEVYVTAVAVGAAGTASVLKLVSWELERRARQRIGYQQALTALSRPEAHPGRWANVSGYQREHWQPPETVVLSAVTREEFENRVRAYIRFQGFVPHHMEEERKRLFPTEEELFDRWLVAPGVATFSEWREHPEAIEPPLTERQYALNRFAMALTVLFRAIGAALLGRRT